MHGLMFTLPLPRSKRGYYSHLTRTELYIPRPHTWALRRSRVTAEPGLFSTVWFRGSEAPQASHGLWKGPDLRRSGS